MYNVPQIKIIRHLFSLLLIVCLWSISQNVLAQTHKLQDVLVLDNGDKIKGRIIQQTDDAIRIRLYNGSEITYRLQDIEEITQEVFVRPSQTEEMGYFHASNIGYNILTKRYYDRVISIQSVNGYRFNPSVAVGLGVGLWHVLDWSTRFPIFLSVSGDIMPDSKVTPIYAVEPSLMRGDFYLSISTGIKVQSESKLKFTCMLNYQKIDSDNYLFLRAGFSF